MAPSMVVGTGGAAAAAVVKPEAVVARPRVVGMWVAAPLCRSLGEHPGSDGPGGRPGHRRRAAQSSSEPPRTWRFFERFVTEEDNWLPPDNFQEDLGVVAHRTSPTNIGLYLLAVLSAREFGWIGVHETVSRLENTMATLDRLERFQGHLLNWYDTVSLEPLVPRYVSTVDSGNLAGHLWRCPQGCCPTPGRRHPGRRWLPGSGTSPCSSGRRRAG
jgi:cyclic beta-1,2-glucan synthetase